MTDDTTCPKCGESFGTPRGVSAHHWQAHGERLRYKKLECDNCGEEIERHKNRLYEHNFCDSDCQYEYLSGENSPNYDTLTVECDWCGKQFNRQRHKIERSDNLYCSLDCYGEAKRHVRGPDHRDWSREKVSCDYCGGSYHEKSSKIESQDHFFCSWGCLESWKAAQSKPKTLLDAVRKNLSAESGTTVARRFKQNRRLKCRMCGSEGEDTAYDVHHIIPILCGGVHEPELMMILCRSCHIAAEKYTLENITERVLVE